MIDEGTRAARRGRWAMAATFFANGFVTGSWAPQIPLLLPRLAIGETMLGVLILVFGLGALVAMPWAGWLMSRHGSRGVLRFFSVAVAFGLPAVVLSETAWLAVPALLVFGGVIGAMDVAMNTNAVLVERRLGRAVMSSSHGFWSLGGFFGGASGGLVIQQAGSAFHAGLTAAMALFFAAATWRFLIDGDQPSPDTGTRKPFSWPSDPLIYLIGLIALFSMIPEGAVLDWAALHLQKALGAEIAVAGFAFAAFSGTMAAMRFLGDRVRDRFGAVTTLRVSSLVAAAGMLAAGLAPDATIAIAAFAFAGLGIANMVPIAFSAAGNHHGSAAGTGMSVATTMGYSGILMAPSAIGFVGERAGFAPVFMALSGLLVLVCLMAGLARGADYMATRPGG